MNQQLARWGIFTLLILHAATLPLDAQTTAPASTTAGSPLADDIAQLQKEMPSKNLEELDHWIRDRAKTRYPAWRAAADAGDALGQYFVARCCLVGAGVPRNTAEGVTWLRKAADQNLALAAEELGNCFRYGKGVRASYDDAITWYKTAADQDFASAWEDLGEMYLYAGGDMMVHPRDKIKPDEAKARECFTKAADKGNTWAMFCLGTMCEHGQMGAPASAPDAAKWLTKAADAGNVTAMRELGSLLRDQRQFADALVWLHRAIEAGDPHHIAAMTLGDMCEAGEGMTRNHEEAVHWYEIADNAGEEMAAQWLAQHR